MAATKLSFFNNGNCWESEPLRASGGDMRLRVHKTGGFPVDIMVSIDGEEEYLLHDSFGFDERRCEITLEGIMPGQFLKLRSRSEFMLVKYIEA